jgi:hypothetical protein
MSVGEPPSSQDCQCYWYRQPPPPKLSNPVLEAGTKKPRSANLKIHITCTGTFSTGCVVGTRLNVSTICAQGDDIIQFAVL